MSDFGLSELGFGDVSRETLDRLHLYADLLRKWSPRINLVSRQSLGDAENRHFRDSAQLIAFAPKDTQHWVDFGSGGGFPGLVVAILARDFLPEAQFTLVESDVRKSVFLRTVSRETSTPVDVRTDRIEMIEPLVADVISARALAPLPKLLSFAHRHGHQNTVGLFPKGATYRSEVKSALENWAFSVDDIPSQTDSDAVILRIEGLRRG